MLKINAILFLYLIYNQLFINNNVIYKYIQLIHYSLMFIY